MSDKCSGHHCPHCGKELADPPPVYPWRFIYPQPYIQPTMDPYPWGQPWITFTSDKITYAPIQTNPAIGGGFTWTVQS